MTIETDIIFMSRFSHNKTTNLTVWGDCDDDGGCMPGLKCGFNNCKHIGTPSFDATDDCCYNPATSSPASFDSKLYSAGHRFYISPGH